MSLSITCPECGDRRTVADEFAGKKLRCKACGAVFRAVDRRSDDAAEGDRPRRRPADEDDTRSRRARRDDDEEPRPRRRARDDDEDEVPRGSKSKSEGRKTGGKKGKKKPSVSYILGLIGALILLAGALTFVGWKAGILESKTDRKPVEEVGEPAYTAPDSRIKIKPVQREDYSEHVRLSNPRPTDAEAGRGGVAIDFELLRGKATDKHMIVVEQPSGQLGGGLLPLSKRTTDGVRGTIHIPRPLNVERWKIRVWIAIDRVNEKTEKLEPFRVSNIIDVDLPE